MLQRVHNLAKGLESSVKARYWPRSNGSLFVPEHHSYSIDIDRPTHTTTTMILPQGGAPTSTTPASANDGGGRNIGFSFSPGGLLLPYHMGVADCLIYEKYMDPSETVVAGSSAGSIASMAIGCGIDPRLGLEGTIAISDRCVESGRSARGNLLPLLQEQMESLVSENEFDFLQQRRTSSRNNKDDHDKTGTGVVLAYREIFPTQKSHFQTKFETREELFRSVGYSCMFPFFTTNSPCLIDYGNYSNNSSSNNNFKLPRLLMDGYFTVPRSQFGCPILQDEFPDSGVDRTVAISCIPQELFGMDAVFESQDQSQTENENSNNSNRNTNSNNLISINAVDDDDDDDDGNGIMSMTDIVRIATQPTSRKELTDLFERGYRDAERWCRREKENNNNNNINNNINMNFNDKQQQQ